MSDAGDATRVHEIIADVLQRREQGERLTDEDVIAAHPDHAGELAEQLRQLKLITTARAQVERAATEETFTLGRTHSADTLLYCPGCESRWDPAAGLNACPNCGAELRDSHEDEPHPGQTIRHYVLVEQIGAGGFGTVWRARDTKLECDVAVKVPRRERLSPDDVDRFIREARVTARLRGHPNIVSVHQADWEDETAFIVSDFIDGVSLGDRLDHARMSFDEAADLVITICGALHHAHEAGVVHRDLKPDNILLDARGTPHVTDFGLAKQESQSIRSEAGRIMGTAAYMSPEQAQGRSDLVDRRSDVFSLGVVFFRMLTGERPFRGSVDRILRQIVHDDPPRPRSFAPGIPGDLETICLKCLEKDPDRRYQSAAELAEDLQRYRKHEPILARPVSAAGRLWRWCRRNPRIPWLSLTLLIVTGAAVVTAGRLSDPTIDLMHSRMEDATERALRLGAVHAADNANSRFGVRFAQVHELTLDQDLRQRLIAWNEIPNDERARNIGLLANGQMGLIPELVDLNDALADAAARLADNNSSTTFSWFVCDARGYQIGRSPPETTMGTLFDYRSYFTGREEDSSRSAPQRYVWRTDDQPRLSDSFVTHTKKACVLAISAPIWDGNEFEGVVGIFIAFGDLVDLPTPEADQFMAIYDARLGLDVARPIDHYGYDDSEVIPGIPKVDLRGEVLVDPFFENEYRFASKRIVDEMDSPLHDLYVVMQEKQSLVDDPVTDLRRNLTVMALSVVGFAAAILIPVWIIILRRVVRQ